MCTTEAIVAIDSHRLDYLTLSLRGKSWTTFNCHIHIIMLLYAHELVEGEATLCDLTLIVLRNSCRIDALLGTNTEGVEHLFVTLLLNLELR